MKQKRYMLPGNAVYQVLRLPPVPRVPKKVSCQVSYEKTNHQCNQLGSSEGEGEWYFKNPILSDSMENDNPKNCFFFFWSFFFLRKAASKKIQKRARGFEFEKQLRSDRILMLQSQAHPKRMSGPSTFCHSGMFPGTSKVYLFLPTNISSCQSHIFHPS